MWDLVLLFVWLIFALGSYLFEVFCKNRREFKTTIKIITKPKERVHYRKCAIIAAKISNTDYEFIKWVKLKEGREEVIDFSRDKYKESTCSINGEKVALHINHANGEDEATYHLEVRFSDGTLRSEKVQIRITGEKPKITVPKEVRVNYGKSVKLTGRIRSSPPPHSVFWNQVENGRVMERILNVSYFYSDKSKKLTAELCLDNVDKNDNGNKYNIQAENIYGSAQSECVVLKVLGEKPVMTVVEHSGDDIRFEGCISISVRIKAIPDPHKIIWKKFDSVKNIYESLDLNQNKYLGSDMQSKDCTRLRIPHATLEDSGKYQVEASNAYGCGKSDEFQIEVRGDKPEVKMESSSDIRVEYGGSIEIKAEYKSVPPLSGPAQWIKMTENSENILTIDSFQRSFRDETTLYLRDRENSPHLTRYKQDILDLSKDKYMQSSSNGSTLLLRIKNVDSSDNGQYMVIVENNYGAVESEPVILRIQGETPNFIEMPKSLTIAHGNTAEFSAEINATPKLLSAVWMHRSSTGFTQSVSMHEDKYKGSASTENSIKLVINKVEFQDEGYYFLRVENLLGSCESTKAHLTVKGDPLIYNSGPTVVMQKEDIQCKAFSDVPTNSHFKWQKIRGDTITDVDLTEDKYKESSTDLQNLTLVITNAEECDKADYRLAAQLAKEEFSNRVTVQILDSGAVITEKKNNCFRMYRLQLVCKKAIQKVFDKYVISLPEFLNNTRNIKILRKKLNKEQLSVVYPQTGKAVASSDFDITLLCSLMRFTDLIQPTAKDENWRKMPEATSIEEADDIIRMKLNRDFLSHSSKFEIDTMDFNDRWLELSKAIHRLEGASNLMPDVWKIQNSVIRDSSEILKIENEINLLREKVKSEELQDAYSSDRNFITTIDIEIKATDSENPEKNAFVKRLIGSLQKTLSEIFDSVKDNKRIQTIKCQLHERSSCAWDEKQRKNLHESFEFARDIAKRIDWSILDIGVLIQFIRFAIYFKSDEHFPDVTISWMRNELSFAIHFAKECDFKKFIEKFSNKRLVQDIASLILNDEYLCKFYLHPADIQISETTKKRNNEQCRVKHLNACKDEIQRNRITLHWENPSDVDELVCFDVRYQENIACHWKLLRTEEGSTAATIKRLKRNTAYIFKVRAVYNDDEGPFSDILRVQTSPSVIPDFLEKCVCIHHGDIALYEVNATFLYVNDYIRICKVQGYFKDLEDRSKRTILLIGTAGSERKMFIEGLINHLRDVVFTCKERLKIPAANFAENKTDPSITVYQLTQCCGAHINIIDCPILIGENDNDRKERLQQFFGNMETPDQIDAVCVCALSQLSESIPDLFSVFSILGEDISSHVLLITSLLKKDTAPILEKFRARGIDMQTSFSFEFSATFSEYKNDVEFYSLIRKWDANEKEYNSFFDCIQSFEPICLSQTIQTQILVIRNRRYELQKLLLNKLKKNEETKKQLKEIEREISVYSSEIHEGEKSLVSETISFDKIENSEGAKNTFCNECFMICHLSCSCEDKEKDQCCAMKHGFCTICPKKCGWKKHSNKPFTITKITYSVSKNDIKAYMERWDCEKAKLIFRAKVLQSKIDKRAVEIKEILLEIYSIIRQVQGCAFYPDPVSTKDYMKRLMANVGDGTSEEDCVCTCTCVTCLKNLIEKY